MQDDGHQGKVTAVVVSYYTGPILFDCLEALLRQPEVSQVVVVNNGNAPGVARRLRELAGAVPALKLLDGAGNIGFAKACNRGGAEVASDYIALVNPDLIVGQGTFSVILDAFSAHPGAWLAGGRLLNLDGSEQRGGRREVLTPWRAVAELLRLEALFPGHPHFRRFNLDRQPEVAGVQAVPTISGAFMILPRSRWRELGGMDERMFLHLEDVDLCLRVLKAGGVVLYCGNAPVRHNRGTSDVPRVWVEWHKTVSSTIYFRKHFSTTYPGWALWGIGAALWLRFLGLAIRHSGPAVAWALRRARGLISGSTAE